MTQPKRLLLSDQQCHTLVRSLREFGYPTLQFEEVRQSADQVAAGTQSDTDVIAIILAQEIDKAVAELKYRRTGK